MTDNFFKNPKRKGREARDERYNEYVPEYKKFGIMPKDFTSKKPVVVPSTSQKDERTLKMLHNVEGNNSLPDFFKNKNEKNYELYDPYDSPTEFFTVEQPNVSESENASFSEESDSEFETESSADDECLLIVNDNIIDINSFDSIQSQVESLVFGSHPKFNNQIPAESIKVYKKMNIKVGVFLE